MSETTKEVETVLEGEGKSLVVVALIAGSDAEKAGIQKGDQIVAINDFPVKTLADYLKGVRRNVSSTKVSLIRAKTHFLEIDVPRGRK